MSTRHERMNDKSQTQKHATILKSLMKVPCNRVCADCKRRDPRWASHNLGIFVCLRCSGVHRSLGVHISKMKSVDLDSWTEDQLQSMVLWGNERANWYWEFKPTYEPTDSNIELYIRCKYERKQFVRSEVMPDPRSIPVGQQNTSAPLPAAAQQQQQQQQQQLIGHSVTSKSGLDDFLGGGFAAPAPAINNGLGSASGFSAFTSGNALPAANSNKNSGFDAFADFSSPAPNKPAAPLFEQPQFASFPPLNSPPPTKLPSQPALSLLMDASYTSSNTAASTNFLLDSSFSQITNTNNIGFASAAPFNPLNTSSISQTNTSFGFASSPFNAMDSSFSQSNVGLVGAPVSASAAGGSSGQPSMYLDTNATPIIPPVQPKQADPFDSLAVFGAFK